SKGAEQEAWFIYFTSLSLETKQSGSSVLPDCFTLRLLTALGSGVQ
ncbi:MAG: hypothetical protein ACI9G6_000319, partial [Limisphaerales bacterium]